MLKTYKIGQLRNGLRVLPRADRKTILLLSDDLRRFSGISTMSREFVLGLCHHYNFIQLGAMVQHPDEGKRVFDLASSIEEVTGVPEVRMKIYPSSGYGNAEVVRTLINMEHVDAILHFTDPRYWEWLYQIEHELRQFVPIFYYDIWDSLPDPLYNETYYRSCDLLMAISKQTYGINKRILPDYEDWQIQYVPHGINQEQFKPVDKKDPIYLEYEHRAFPNGRPKFVVGFNSRNIKRKCPSDLIRAFSIFRSHLPSEEEQSNVALLMHTRAADQTGTDLRKVRDIIDPKLPVYFSENEIPPQEMKYFYGLCDVFVNISSNEGFGLSTAEAVTCGVPIIVNVTGGLQDQCGFQKDGRYLTAEDYIELGSLHKHKNLTEYIHGEWCAPCAPAANTLVGSLPTPYIFDDLPNVSAFVDALHRWYKEKPENRRALGEKGRAAFKELGLYSEYMSESMGKAMARAFEKWKPRHRYELRLISSDVEENKRGTLV